MALTYNIHKQRQTPWGWEVRVVVWDGTEHVKTFKIYFPTQPSFQDIIDGITARLAKIQAKLDFEADRVKAFDKLEQPVKNALIWVIEGIREHPAVTFAQAENAWDTEMADEFFSFEKLVIKFRNLAGNITWEQFKTFVINNKFEGLD